MYLHKLIQVKYLIGLFFATFVFCFLGMLSSSEDDADSYSSDGEEGSLVIDAQPQQQTNEINQNGHQVDHKLTFTNSPDKERH